jgi:hypothetical protein
MHRKAALPPSLQDGRFSGEPTRHIVPGYFPVVPSGRAKDALDARVLDFENVQRPLDFLLFPRQPQQPLFVPTQRQPLVEQAVDLLFQFAAGPIVLDRLDFIKRARLRFVHPEQMPIE